MFSKIGKQFNACAGQKKTHVFFGNVRPKSNAHAYLKQRKKHSGLMPGSMYLYPIHHWN